MLNSIDYLKIIFISFNFKYILKYYFNFSKFISNYFIIYIYVQIISYYKYFIGFFY